VALLVAILGGTLALGGLFYGTLNVVSLGFASILIGLAEDFGIVLYQESRSHPHLSLQEIRREAAPGIWWSMLTTAGAFLLLNLSGLPGLGQLGTLVAIGVALAAVVMLYAYLPPLLKAERRSPVRPGESSARAQVEPGVAQQRSFPALLVTVVIILAGVLLLWLKPPRFDSSPGALKPRHSAANDALEELKVRLDRTQEPLWLLFEGHDTTSVAHQIESVEPILQGAVSNRWITGFTLPGALWPRVANQARNLAPAVSLASLREAIRQSILAAGFTTNSTVIAENVLRVWEHAGSVGDIFWPTNENSRWVLEKLTARATNHWLAIGLVYPAAGGTAKSLARLTSLSDELLREGVRLSGWELLGPSVSVLVLRDLKLVLGPIVLLVIATLWLAFRDGRNVAWSLATLSFSVLALHIVMTAAGWSWNMMNVMALPLLLGMSVDFSIHIQLALRRHGGDRALVRRSVGRALLLAGSTTVAGFASLSFASNSGIAGLGMICATGIICAMLTAVYLLPAWWRTTSRTKPA
jgi:predicted exporter